VMGMANIHMNAAAAEMERLRVRFLGVDSHQEGKDGRN
jgi:hypothetical protein